jgi:broad specificity phosphatase PhoE
MAQKRKSILLTLVRCGETTWDAEDRLHGRSDLPLSIDGRASVIEQAAGLAGRSIGNVFHGPDDASLETAQLVAGVVKARTKSVDGLAAPDLGVLEGITTQDFAERFSKRHKQWQEDPLSLSPPEGEDLAHARARIFSAVARLIRRARADELALVLHALGLGLLRCWLAERPASDLWEMVRTRPPVERYLLSMDMAAGLDEVAAAQFTHT